MKRPAWVNTIEPAMAPPDLSALYQRIAGARGSVSNILLSHSLNPKALAAHFDLYMAIQLAASPLTRVERELTAVAVSQTNGCHY